MMSRFDNISDLPDLPPVPPPTDVSAAVALPIGLAQSSPLSSPLHQQLQMQQQFQQQQQQQQLQKLQAQQLHHQQQLQKQYQQLSGTATAMSAASQPGLQFNGQQQQQHLLMPPSNGGGIMAQGASAAANGAITAGQNQLHAEQRRRAIQQQLLLLIHAHKCQMPSAQANQPLQPPNVCKVLHCGTMKNVLQHMARCKDGKECAFPHCGSSRQIIAHYSNCKYQQCPICAPLRRQQTAPPPPSGALGVTQAPQISHQPTMQPLSQAQPTGSMVMAGGDASVIGGIMMEGMPSLGGLGTMPVADIPGVNVGVQPGTGASWRQTLNLQHRTKLVQKLVEALSDCISPEEQQRRGEGIRELARKIEETVYRSATKQEDYYHLLAEKIYKLKKAQEARSRQGGPGQLPGQVPNFVSPPGVPMMRPMGGASTVDASMLPGMASAAGAGSLIMGGLPPALPPTMTMGGVMAAEPAGSGGARRLKRFDPAELKHHFQPVLHSLRKYNEASPFLKPVDYVELGIPDYPHIIKRPMDLQTMANKLNVGQYRDPWQFCDDFRLMIDNAWTYNKKSSRIYKVVVFQRDERVREEGVPDVVPRYAGRCVSFILFLSFFLLLGFCCSFHLPFLYHLLRARGQMLSFATPAWLSTRRCPTLMLFRMMLGCCM